MSLTSLFNEMFQSACDYMQAKEQYAKLSRAIKDGKAEAVLTIMETQNHWRSRVTQASEEPLALAMKARSLPMLQAIANFYDNNPAQRPRIMWSHCDTVWPRRMTQQDKVTRFDRSFLYVAMHEGCRDITEYLLNRRDVDITNAGIQHEGSLSCRASPNLLIEVATASGYIDLIPTLSSAISAEVEYRREMRRAIQPPSSAASGMPIPLPSGG